MADTPKKIKPIKKKTRKFGRVISKNEWMKIGSKAGWFSNAGRIAATPDIDEAKEQVERHEDFIENMKILKSQIEGILDQMEKVNHKFKTQDKDTIFHDNELAAMETVEGLVELFYEQAQKQKQQLCQEQAYAISEKFESDPGFRKHIEA